MDKGGGEGEDDPGGGDKGGMARGLIEREKEKDEEEEGGTSGGQVHLRGALLQTYILSILIRSIMEVKDLEMKPCEQVTG